MCWKSFGLPSAVILRDHSLAGAHTMAEPRLLLTEAAGPAGRIACAIVAHPQK